MGTPQNRILIVAGEASGDMRGAGVVRAVKAINPSIHFVGVGGTYMQQAGVELLANVDELGVVGIWDVVKHLPVIKRLFERLTTYTKQHKVDAVILVDYPGFNMRLAKAFKAQSLKVIYYVSPQVWAWKEKRINTIKQIVDRMMVLFPFEKAIYAKYGMDVDYVGHPLLDEVKITEPPGSIKAALGFKPQHQVIGLMPGSRLKEITRHLPVMLQSAKLLLAQNPDRRFIVPRAATVDRALLKQMIDASGVPAVIYEGPIYNGMGAMDAAIIASGTATLEAGLLLRPMVIMYKTAWLTYGIAKMFLKIPYIGLVNVVAGKRIVEEFIQEDAKPENIAAAIDKLLSDPNAYGQMTNDLAQVKSSLGHSGASSRAAQVVLSCLHS